LKWIPKDWTALVLLQDKTYLKWVNVYAKDVDKLIKPVTTPTILLLPITTTLAMSLVPILIPIMAASRRTTATTSRTTSSTRPMIMSLLLLPCDSWLPFTLGTKWTTAAIRELVAIDAHH
jgi:hypothetical protein